MYLYACFFLYIVYLLERRFFVSTEGKMLQLSKKWVDYLCTQPETGMGYQDTDITLSGGRRYKAFVFGTEANLSENEGIEESMIVEIKVYERGDRVRTTIWPEQF